MDSIAVPFQMPSPPDPDGRNHRLRQGLQRAGDQGNLEQGGVIQTGIDTAADEAEHPLPVVEAHHALGLE